VVKREEDGHRRIEDIKTKTDQFKSFNKGPTIGTKLGRGDVKSSEHRSLKGCKRKVEVEVFDEVGIHIEKRRVGSMRRSDILARHYRFKYDILLLKISRNIILLPELRYTLIAVIHRRNLHGCDFKAYSN
jgi:hypothetical protein